MDGRPTARIQVLDAFMTDAGFDARLSPVIEREMWEKWLMLASIGPDAGQRRGGRGRSRRTGIYP
jgi:2-dehydropantoate 2-reductase